MKKSILYTAFVFASLCYACTSKKHGLAEAKTTQEAIEAVSGIEYKLVQQKLNRQVVPIKQQSTFTFLEKGLKDIQLEGFEGKPGVAGILTNLKGFSNQDEQKPFLYNVTYFDVNSQKHIEFEDFGATFLGDTLVLGFVDSNLNKRIYYFKKQ